MCRVAILQSNYIPWKGYFDIINDVDLFVFYDDVQYTKFDWRNRNRVKTRHGVQWLTVPVGARTDRLISEVRLLNGGWARSHWDKLLDCYRDAPYFGLYKSFFKDVYSRPWEFLSEFNQHVTTRIAVDLLGVKTRFETSASFSPEGKRLDRILDLLRKVGASEYVSGPMGKKYIDENRFREAGIRLTWKDYSGYPEYPQLHPPFTHEVTIADLLFHTGAGAPWFIWNWRERAVG